MSGAPQLPQDPLPPTPPLPTPRRFELDPYRPERIRARLGFAMLAIFALTVAFLGAAAITGHWADVREFAEVTLPLEGAMLGSAITFYFTARRE